MLSDLKKSLSEKRASSGSSGYQLTPLSQSGPSESDGPKSPPGTASPEVQLLDFIKAKMSAVIEDIKVVGKKNSALWKHVRGRQMQAEETYEMILALDEKMHGLEHTLACLTGTDDFRIDSKERELKEEELRALQPLRPRLPVLPRSNISMHFPPSIPLEIQATLLVERMHALERLKEKVDEMYGILEPKAKELAVSVKNLESHKQEYDENILSLEQTINEYHQSEVSLKDSNELLEILRKKMRATKSPKKKAALASLVLSPQDTSILSPMSTNTEVENADEDDDDLVVETIDFDESNELDVFEVREGEAYLSLGLTEDDYAFANSPHSPRSRRRNQRSKNSFQASSFMGPRTGNGNSSNSFQLKVPFWKTVQK